MQNESNISIETNAASVFEPIADAESPLAMARELSALSATQRLFTSGSYTVALARSPQIPTICREIGRLRELAFRAVGEGTGHARDLDRFDAWYMHLFVWDETEQQVMGAYRIGMADVIVRQQGIEGLYTSTLFDYEPGFFEAFGPALELGRSFVRPELQRSSLVLAYLWRGIGRLIALRPRYAKLFGPVSVSSAYSEQSRRLIAESLFTHEHRHELAERVRPLRPLQTDHVSEEGARSGVADVSVETDMKRLNRRVAEVEPDGKGVPTLVREYVKLGGRFLAFSVDPAFGDALDGLVAVELERTHPRLLSLYMGDEAFRHFSELRYRTPPHSPAPAQPRFEAGYSGRVVAE